MAASASGCASHVSVVSAAALFDDQLFDAPADPPAELLDPRTVFTLSPAMLSYAHSLHTSNLTQRDGRRVLLSALYGNGVLRLNYDASATRTAAQAFDSRAGNCLSLAIMTAAFAGELGFPVSFQSVFLEPTFARQGGLLISSGHVNLV
ncbi:MAG: hypothetical protein M3Y32_04275, partial [Pseudomonadota bacterium]|nr:hypothetical protein [Pseudomonadota bacterium]